MKKQQLLKLGKLTATEEMMRLAKADIPVQQQGQGCVEYIYKYGIHMIADVEAKILKVALFLTDYMALEAMNPIYSLFIDKEADDFIGYDHLCKKWTNAMIDRLRFPYPIYRSGIYCEEGSAKCIQEYLETDSDPYDALQMFQSDLRRRNTLKKHKRITDQWDLVMQDVPELPQDWENWMKKVGFLQNHIFFEYNRKGVTHGFCTWCEKDVPVKNPKHNQDGECSCCHHKIKYKSIKRVQSVITEEDTAYLVQDCGTGFVVREFMINMAVKMSDYRKTMFQWHERRRFVYDKDFIGAEYFYGYDRTAQEYRWRKGDLTKAWGPGWLSYVQCVRGQTYKENVSSLDKTLLGRTGLPEYIKGIAFVDPCEYIRQFRNQPILEKIVKTGLMQLAKEIVNENKVLDCADSEELVKALYIDRFRLERLRKRNGGTSYLEWLQYEKKMDKVIPDSVIGWMRDKGIVPEDLTFINDYMSEIQVKNYLERQAAESGEKVKDLLTIWQDYLIMAKRSQIDITDPIIYRTRNLVYRHNELAKTVGDKSVVLQAEEVESKYPMLPQICGELKKYEYSDTRYKIVAPQRVEDIIIEGRKLRHCIHNNDRYFERMSKRESYILFLRKSSKDSEPYYTLEVEPNGTVRQKRTLYNRQLEDIEKAEKFLQRWQKQLQKKLYKEDFELAKRSKELRIKEMEDLRKNKVRINGNFNGRLLADILAEDLMEVTETEALAA